MLFQTLEVQETNQRMAKIMDDTTDICLIGLEIMEDLDDTLTGMIKVHQQEIAELQSSLGQFINHTSRRLEALEKRRVCYLFSQIIVKLIQFVG